VLDFDCFSAEAAEVAEKGLLGDNAVRYDAAVRLGELGNPVVSPYLAHLLADKEWDVRLAALKALVKLRHQGFSHRDEELLKQMFLSLGDDEVIVQDVAAGLIQTLQPSDDILRFSIMRMATPKGEASPKLAGIRAAAKLCRMDEDYTRLLDFSILHQLLKDDAPLVREECLHLLGILDEPEAFPWILETLSDPIPSVRQQAMRTIGWSSYPPEVHEIEHLLHDPDQDVRLLTLYALEETELLEEAHISLAFTDSSKRVRELAELLKKDFGLFLQPA
jgi:HEAT repeat protein